MKEKMKNIISWFAVGVMVLTNVISPIVTAYNANSASTSFIMPDRAVSLIAKSKWNPYKVSFNANPGSDTINPVSGTMTDQDFIYGTAQNLTGNKYTRTGYTFAWWSTGANTSVAYTNGQSVNNLTTTSGGTVTLYAKWIAKTGINYTVNHYLMDTGGNYPTTPSYTNTYSWTTYEVVTWATRIDTWMTLSWSLQSEHLKWDWTTVFNYYYKRSQYPLIVNAGRWVASVSWGWQKYYNQSVTVSWILMTGYKNLSWEIQNNTTVHPHPNTSTSYIFNMPNSLLTVTLWATPITYTITYNVWSGTISWQPTTYTVEAWLQLPNPTRTWYDFAWWTWTTNPTTPKTGLIIPEWTYGDLTYTAVWTPKWDVAYKVHHMHQNIVDNNYTQSWSTEQLAGTADASLTLANLAHDVDGDCVTYTGWSLVASTSGLSSATPTVTIMPDGSTEIYLYYTRNQYTVTLTHDTWISTVATEWTYKCGATVNLTATPATWYGFKAWEVVSPSGWTPGS